jgi:hypothetical protein
MAQDNVIPLGKPGIASFESESWGNTDELLFGDTPPVATQVATVLAGANIDWPLGTVINIAANGTVTQAAVTTGVSNANAITASPVLLANGQSMSIPIYKAGHFRQQALTFAATFTTDALKQNAFTGSTAPMILISKAKYAEADFPA